MIVQDAIRNPLVTPGSLRGAAVDPPSGEALAFHRRLPGYRVTPLRPLAEAARRLDIDQLFAKDESARFGLPSFKVLGASWAIARLLEQRFDLPLESWSSLDRLRALTSRLPGLALVAASDGNHGRAVAAVARWLGVACRIYVPRGTAAARIAAVQAEGATCAVVDGEYDRAVAVAAQDGEADASGRTLVVADTSWPGYDTIPRWVSDGYDTLFAELDEQLGKLGSVPGLVVLPIGVGALAAAAVRHYRSPNAAAAPILLGVEPVGADSMLASVRHGGPRTLTDFRPSIMVGLNCETPSLAAWPLVAGGVDVLVAIPDDRAREAMRVLADAGVVAGETGAAALGGLLELVGTPEAGPWREALGLRDDTAAVVLSTEGATDPLSYREIVGRAPGGVIDPVGEGGTPPPEAPLADPYPPEESGR